MYMSPVPRISVTQLSSLYTRAKPTTTQNPNPSSKLNRRLSPVPRATMTRATTTAPTLAMMKEAVLTLMTRAKVSG